MPDDEDEYAPQADAEKVEQESGGPEAADGPDDADVAERASGGAKG